uniref:Uncharacterized protein n=1 Tax=Fagus sylvatica TaxID=28930 RepID=A0A2N9EVX8_FAGSY
MVNLQIEHTADGASKAVTYLRSKLDNVDQLINKKSRYVSCPKVPPILRNDERSKDYYDPKIVSFGPYHHENLNSGQYKRSKQRSCYVDGSTDAYDDDDEAFALMMLQDGCFILALFEYEAFVSKYLDIFQYRYALLDTILLENQIPFRVLDVLMSNIYEENKGLEMVTSFLRDMHWGNILEQDTPDKDKEPNHLLGLQITLISKCDCLVKIYPQDFTSIFPSFGSVSDLQAVGINFKASNSISLHSAKKEIPKSISLRDVKFRPGFFTGELILPPLLLTPDALVYYNNLIAFEMCATYIDATITSYISFMNSLIANPEDVKVLRSKHIILHTLNSDEEVFKLLKEMGRKWMPVDAFIYQSVRKDIQKHYNSKIRIWIAVIRHKYFSQPWSVFGLLAAVVAIILSFLQTFYTIHPRKG